MADARYFCPTCGCIDIIEGVPTILTKDGTSANTHTCPNCGWSGTEEEAHGVYTSDKMWGIEQIAEVMLRVLAIHAAAPLIQMLEFQGLIPRESDAADENDVQVAQLAKDHVMKSIFSAAAEAAFTAAGEVQEIVKKGRANEQ